MTQPSPDHAADLVGCGFSRSTACCGRPDQARGQSPMLLILAGVGVLGGMFAFGIVGLFVGR